MKGFFLFERIDIKILIFGVSQMIFTFFFNICIIQSFLNEHTVESYGIHISLIWLVTICALGRVREDKEKY